MRIFICALIAIVMSCCTKKKNNNSIIDSAQAMINESMGKKIVFPKELIYSPLNVLDSTSIINAKLKIYAFVDASCGSCISKIELWDQFLEMNNHLEVPVIIVCRSDDNFELFEYLLENEMTGIDEDIIFLYDEKDKYLISNQFMEEYAHLRAVLTDHENRMLLIGNPVYNQSLLDRYVKAIKVHSN